MLASFFLSSAISTALLWKARSLILRAQKKSKLVFSFDAALSGIAFGLTPLFAFGLISESISHAGIVQHWVLFGLGVGLFVFAGLASVLIACVYGLSPVSYIVSSLAYALVMIAGFATAIAAAEEGRAFFTILVLAAGPLSFFLHRAVFHTGKHGLINLIAPALALNAILASGSFLSGSHAWRETEGLFSHADLGLFLAALALLFVRSRPYRSTGGDAEEEKEFSLNNLPDEVCAIVTDEKGALLSATPLAQKIFGASNDDLNRRIIQPLFTPVPAGRADKKDEIFCFLDHAGVKHYARLRRKHLHDGPNASKELIFIEIIDHYMRESALRQQLLGRMESIIDANEDMLLFVSRSGLIIDINRTGLEFLKKARADCVGEPVWRLFPETPGAPSLKDWRSLLQAGGNDAVKIQTVLADHEGARRLFHLSVSKVSGSSNENEFLFAARDITDIAEARKSFQEAQARLEQTIAERTKALNAAKMEADEANISKSRFLANMSHELRTPLNAILGYTDLMKEEIADAGKTDSQDYEDLERITVNGRNLLALINDVLDLAKIEANKMTFRYEEVCIEDFFRDIRSSIEPIAMKQGNDLVFDHSQGPLTMTVDRQKITQCLLNLLSNAAKFTTGGRISLRCWSREDDGEPMLYFEVTDTGKGMTPQQCASIFDEFVQIEDHANGGAGGTGLGLPITRRFCQLMGGGIEATSSPGSGSRFTMWVKNGPAEAQVRQPVQPGQLEAR